MTAAPFVPLMPGAMKPTEATTPARLKVVPAAAPVFQPSTPQSSRAVEPQPAPKHEMHGEPKITLERQGETITHIRVECGCGQVIELKCQY